MKEYKSVMRVKNLTPWERSVVFREHSLVAVIVDALYNLKPEVFLPAVH